MYCVCLYYNTLYQSLQDKKIKYCNRYIDTLYYLQERMIFMHILEEIQNTFQKEAHTISIIEPNEIPNIDLYMDQVTTFMERTLQAYKRNEDTKILTKTMINNYTKAKLLPPPVKKKYTPTHIMLLIMIFHLKAVLSMRDIATLFQPLLLPDLQESEKKIEMIYKGFVSLQKAVQDNIQSAKPISEQELLSAYDEETSKIMLLLLLAIRANAGKHLAERILDRYF